MTGNRLDQAAEKRICETKILRQRQLTEKGFIYNGWKMAVVTVGHMARYVWKPVKEKRCRTL